MTIFNLWFFLS